MLFNSYEFVLLYLPVVWLVFMGLGKYQHRAAALWLGAASLFFYGYWNPKFVMLLLASIGWNYGMSLAIVKRADARASAKSLLTVAIAVNLALLAWYKYANFFIETVNATTGAGWLSLDVILPIGISFFTFTQIAFLVDVYRGKAREADPIHYLLFVTYFPHLIAGPVLHHGQMMPQFANPRTYSPMAANIASGLVIFGIGLAKKILLADSFSEYASPIFDSTKEGVQPTLFVAWTGALAYTLQLYFDFSGYCDMAIGLSRMFNVELPLNFNSPYRSTSIVEFWRRWHMTLSQFLRDYLYIALGGNRHGEWRRQFNLMTTMVLGGLWHGANWTFVVWGAMHGLFLVINHAWTDLTDRLGIGHITRSRPGRLLSGALTFVSVVFAWVFFRAENFDSALTMIRGMTGLGGWESWSVILSTDLPVYFNGFTVPYDTWPRFFLLFAIGFGIVFGLPNSQTLVSRIQFGRLRDFVVIGSASTVCLLLIIINGSIGSSEFIYFNF